MSRPAATNIPPGTACAEALAELALNLRWSWNHASDEIWGQLDPELWELTQNPWLVLQTISREKLEAVARNPAFERRLAEILAEKRDSEHSPGWFQRAYPDSALKLVVYFSMEYMLSEALPIYSGGLGNVAGDQLKAASDLAVPVVAIGLLYQSGYFRQEIDVHGGQQALYPVNDPGLLPIEPLRQPNGEWLRMEVILTGGLKLWIRAWKAAVGRTTLFLLDTNDPANLPSYRGITSELYGGGPDLRIRQEAVLGIGGWRLLRALGLQPEVAHLNEGHASFAILERARSYMLDHKCPFGEALAVTRAGNLFTTHTPVEAGFDRFAPELMEKYFRYYALNRLGIPMQEFLALGRRNANDPGEPFNMAYLALHGCGAVNGVSRLHGEVSRRIFQPLFPRWPQREVPVTHVTNGIHTPTWDSADADALWTAACGLHRWRGTTEDLAQAVRQISDSDLWRMRQGARRRLVDYLRKQVTRQRAGQGASTPEIAEAGQIFGPEVLTLCFARRFASYKRPDLLLQDPERLLRILTNAHRPVQLILAGKAHPRDAVGQAILRRWIEFINRPEARAHAVFLADYDMHMTEQLVAGVDLWVNTPRRPWEASGTSGMKMLVNGGLNLSELDGWWAEAYSPDVGWALGDGQEHGDDPAWDHAEAQALYELLEREVVPEFYDRGEHGMPKRWLARIRESMARLTPYFSANRSTREYTEIYYLPAAVEYRRRADDAGRLLQWRGMIRDHFREARFDGVRVHTHEDAHLFQVEVYFGGLDPDAVRVELYAEPAGNGEPFSADMSRGSELPGPAKGYLYSASAPAARPPGDYTPRLIPHMPGVAVPLEAAEILWQR